MECIRKEQEHLYVAITQAVRKPLRGQAKRIILPLGTTANIAPIMIDLKTCLEMWRQDKPSGISCSHTKREWNNYSLGLRLEEIYQRVTEKRTARVEDRDNTLKEKFWKSFRSKTLKMQPEFNSKHLKVSNTSTCVDLQQCYQLRQRTLSH